MGDSLNTYDKLNEDIQFTEDETKALLKLSEKEILILVLSEMKNRGLEYNVKAREYCNFIESGIIDPVKVTRVALENAVSIASMMLTTECLMVQEKPTETKA